MSAAKSVTIWLHDEEAQQWLTFGAPLAIFEAWHVEEVMPLLQRAEHAVEAEGAFAVGFICYEAAPAFDDALRVKKDQSPLPLAWFALFDPREKQVSSLGPEANSLAEPELGLALPISNPAYVASVERIQRYIQAGDSYQVNFSMRLKSAGIHGPLRLFKAMVAAQGDHYSAFIETENWAICSASPELFFRLNGEQLTCRPMKGTAPRGLWSSADQEQAEGLQRSEKNRAENLMIVDMARNDLGRIAKPGSVHVSRMFDVERYPTLWQMTSTVECQTPASLAEIFRALFPAASITGAPKVRTMEIIRDLEESPRRIYTGAMGYYAPGRRAQFNVAIRTLLMDKTSGAVEYGIGSGIVADSAPSDELEECKLKAEIFVRPQTDFELLETMLWEPDKGYFLLEEHLRRLTKSAAYFGRQICIDAIRETLMKVVHNTPQGPQAVRVTNSQSGEYAVSMRRLMPLKAPYRIALAVRPVSSGKVSLFHKTTDRSVYETARRSRPDADDVLLWNDRGELTECTIANVALEIDGRWLTPPVGAGLLPGVYRDYLLSKGKIQERVLHIEDLARSSRVMLFNSVRRTWNAWVSGAGTKEELNTIANST